MSTLKESKRTAYLLPIRCSYQLRNAFQKHSCQILLATLYCNVFLLNVRTRDMTGILGIHVNNQFTNLHSIAMPWPCLFKTAVLSYPNFIDLHSPDFHGTSVILSIHAILLQNTISQSSRLAFFQNIKFLIQLPFCSIEIYL